MEGRGELSAKSIDRRAKSREMRDESVKNGKLVI